MLFLADGFEPAGLKRCGKSCRLRWLNYLRPNIKHGEFTDDEDKIICSLYASIGSRYHLPSYDLSWILAFAKFNFQINTNLNGYLINSLCSFSWICRIIDLLHLKADLHKNLNRRKTHEREREREFLQI